MYGKFNIAKLGSRDDVLLGMPWLKAMNPTIDWVTSAVSLPSTPRSDDLEREHNLDRRKNKLPKLSFTKPKKKPLTQKKPPKKACQKPTIEEVLEELPPLLPDPDDEEMPVKDKYDTKDDVWEKDTMAPPIKTIAEFPLRDDKVLLEYSPDFVTLRIAENLSFDSPLTRDGTSRNELRRLALSTPVRHTWATAASQEEVTKLSNKAQQFAVASNQALMKKPFEELVPSYLHDFADIFAKDGLNKLPPE
jgi:hypothetical protein